MDQRQTTGRILTRQPKACGNSQNRAETTGGPKWALTRCGLSRNPRSIPANGNMPRGENREAKPNVYIKCLFLEDCVVWGSICGNRIPRPAGVQSQRFQPAFLTPKVPGLHTGRQPTFNQEVRGQVGRGPLWHSGATTEPNPRSSL